MAIHLGGSSRNSLAATRALLDKSLSGLSGEAAAALSSDLFVVVNVLGQNVSLRRAITDPARSAEDKGKLLKQLFGSKISETAQSIAISAAVNRWSSPSDLLISMEQIAIQAEAGAANARGHLDQLEDELFTFSRILVSNQDLRNALNGNSDAVTEKRALVNQVLKSASSSARALVGQIVNGLWGRNIETALADILHATAEHRNLVVAKVSSAIDLTTEQKNKLASALSKQIGQAVRINVETNPKVVGGVSIRFRDELIDGTVISRMAEASQALAGK
ncbi:MAG: F0F1 ATP synthase subunit delta [Candidatus Nanopelagicaceae bacterium]